MWAQIGMEGKSPMKNGGATPPYVTPPTPPSPLLPLLLHTIT